MAALKSIFKLTSLEQDVSRPGDLLVEIGTDTFDVSATVKEVTTALTEVLYSFLNIKDATPVANDLLSTDNVVTTSAVSVLRPVGTTSSLTFDFMFVGRQVVAA